MWRERGQEFGRALSLELCGAPWMGLPRNEEVPLDRADQERCWSLFLQHRARLTRYVKRLMPEVQDPVDVVQEVGLRLLRQPPMPLCFDRFDAWCRSVARHVVLHELRSARHERKKLAALGLDGSVNFWQPELQAEMRSTLVRRLKGVDAESCELLTRRYVLEQTSEEIAQAMNLSAAAVRMRLMRLRDSLSAPVRRDAARRKARSVE